MGLKVAQESSNSLNLIIFMGIQWKWVGFVPDQGFVKLEPMIVTYLDDSADWPYLGH